MLKKLEILFESDLKESNQYLVEQINIAIRDRLGSRLYSPIILELINAEEDNAKPSRENSQESAGSELYSRVYDSYKKR